METAVSWHPEVDGGGFAVFRGCVLDISIQRVGGFPMRIFVSVITALLLLVVSVDGSAQVCPPTIDCNANGQADSCDITQGLSDAVSYTHLRAHET